VLHAANVISESGPKLGQMVAAILVFFAVLLFIFFAAARATGRFQRPLAIVIFLTPAVLLMSVGLVIPAIRTVIYSFQSDDSSSFVGFSNYTWVFTNPDERQVLLNTVLWIIIAPLLATAFGLVLALMADRMSARAENITKSLIFMPMAISFVGASIIWKFVYEARDPNVPQVGLLSEVVMKLGWHNPPNWILWEPWNNLLLMIIMIWVETGFAMVVLSAAIKAIPGDVIEAAQIDGATGFKLFRLVTVPLIRGTLVVVLTTIMITVLKVFDIVLTMTGGNFGTSVLSNEMWQQYFVQFSQGHGTALATILFVGVIPLIVYNVVQLRKERTVR
jgi:alpha-glucoside transport system permease protein